ncbi:MAG: YhcH/YjgK/YiaL family protein [Rikenellaceae bacterium]
MIVSDLKYSDRVEGQHPLFKRAFAYVKSCDLLDAPLGRIELEGEDLFINNVELQGVEAAAQPLEMHRKYIDIHILLRGEESVGWRMVDTITTITKEYDAESDCALAADRPASQVTLRPGEFVIVYPEDAHAPAIGQGAIRKLIVKVKL